MLRNHLLVALRGLARRKGYAALHVLGLSVGLACCFLVLLFVAHERSYDRFHADADRIFRLGEERMLNGNPVQLVSTPLPVAEALRADVSFVEAVVQLNEAGGLLRTPESGEAFEEKRVLFASGAFFEVFSFALVRGDPAAALAAPATAVVSETLADRLFGDADPMGRTVLLERQGFGIQEDEPLALTVTGVAQDVPAASTLRFQLVVSGTTEVRDFGGLRPALDGAAVTYVRTRAATDREALAEVLGDISMRSELGFGSYSKALVDPLLALHFAYRRPGTFSGNPRYLALFSSVALLILLIACINYTNLSTAYAAQRTREVGVRKTLGARRGEVAARFYAETALLTGAAWLAALGLVAMALPAFGTLVGATLAFDPVRDGALLLGMTGIAALVAVLAGAYPALFLSRFRPTAILRGDGVQPRGGVWLRQGLVVVQFTATVALLATTALVYEQLRFAQTRDLGFDGDRVLTLDLSAPALGRQREALGQALAALPGVRAMTFASAAPGAFHMLSGMEPVEAEGAGALLPVYFAHSDPHFASTYGLELAAGRFFADGDGAGVVLNEAAARALGLMTTDAAEALGRQVRMGVEHEVVGVLRDFHFASLHHEIGAIALMPLGEVYNTLFVSLKLDAADLPGTLAAVEQVWQRHAPYHPFAYRFVDDQFDALYRNEQRLGQLFGMVAGVAVLLACLGLLGLVAFAAERRRREIGVRKVLGASVASLVGLLSKEFLALVAVAFALGAPLAYVVAQRWLEDFAYRVELGAGPFVLVGLAALGLAVLTVSSHAIRAATADPVEALRAE